MKRPRPALRQRQQAGTRPVTTDPAGSHGRAEILAELASIIRSVVGTDLAPDVPLMQVTMRVNSWVQRLSSFSPVKVLLQMGELQQ